MRLGNNPHKDKYHQTSDYVHQIVIPVFIPNQDGYFKDSFAILKLCLNSLFQTIHDKTFITIVNNGSDEIIYDYLESLFKQNKIQEVIHTDNIGKLNAILKGVVGNDIDLVTISDSDVLFLSNWQYETVKIFSSLPKAGVVGIVPQFKTYESYCGNVLFDTFFSKKLRFLPVKNKKDLIRFYDSLGWDRNYNQDYLEYALGLQITENCNALVGSGHFVATYKKDLFEQPNIFFQFKMGGDSETYLDKLPLKKDYWRLTTQNNYAYHMGNTLEDWMTNIQFQNQVHPELKISLLKRNKINGIMYFIKNRLFVKLFSVKIAVKLFLKWKKLPNSMIEKY